MPRSFARLVGVTATAVLSLVAGAPAAQATGQDGVINNDELIFYYNSNYAGSWSDFANRKASLTGYTFLKSGLAGYGQAVRNNSASVGNYRSDPARIYINNDFLGSYDQVAADGSRNLSTAYNQNASFQWGPF